MKHIIEDWDQELYPSALWDFYFDGLRAGVLDIETTGLDPSRNKIILVGIYDVHVHNHKQVLAESRAEEPLALGEYMDVLADLDLLITYNGKHFDVPFTDTRLKKHPETASLSCSYLYDFDLYQVLSRYSPIRKLVPNMRQKTVENYMGLWDARADEISGAESVELYNQYEATADPDAEARILLHNNDDIRQLTRLTKAITKSDLHKAMFHIGFPVKRGPAMVTVTGIHLRSDRLDFNGEQNRMPVVYMGFDYNGWPVSSRFTGQSFEVSVPVIRQSGLTVIDLQAAGLTDRNTTDLRFEDYPGCAGGFLVIEDETGIKYRETNHFIKEFTKKIMEECL
ncbi:MAG: ribonuclease H-like domain-containing protein [Eubacteriales bacterium]|nr:ribonuclease H-like domain-containing protein [Eubacteriales bacterium]